MPETHDLYCRRVYVVRSKPELIVQLKELGSKLDADAIELLQSPTVVMTEEVPFERDLEGWRVAIMNKCKEAYLRESMDFFPLSALELPEGLLTDMATLTAFFDQWWDAEEADSIEIVSGSWKTRECCSTPPHESKRLMNWTSYSPKCGTELTCGTISIPAYGFAEDVGRDEAFQVPLGDPDYGFWKWLLKRWPYKSVLSHEDIPLLKDEYLNA
ncbi:hypothetical protein [Prosthecobacter sp.]|uniref:hypothetical protein n=1 Tax=Prosthecobacter sp. TaxID=1965333 RepID=UPI0037850870